MTFERIYTRTVELAPQLAPQNTRAIHEWLIAGYDTDKDILPAIEQQARQGLMTVHSFAFFTPAIQRQNEKRIKAETLTKQATHTNKYGYKKHVAEPWQPKEVRERVGLGLKQLGEYLLEIKPVHELSCVPEEYQKIRQELFKPRGISKLTGKPL